jgi:tetratricopeptide (TPR) repeat protein/predicted Ser/Thr protein kinase
LTGRSDRLRQLFEAALELPADDRAAFLDSQCAGDTDLRRELDSLLAAEQDMGSFLDEHDLGAVAAATLPASDDPLIGRTIGRYKIIEEAARGGMGVVYRAEQTNPDRQVALKVMAHGLNSPEALRRFEVEVQMLGRLQHPGIAQIFEAGTAETGHGSRPFFAMEFIDGPLLTDWASQQNLDLHRRLALMVKICAGVQHAHQKGVIHRDLKPANILVDRSGQPKILDFGVARSTDADLQLTTLGGSGSGGGSGGLLGTLPYMSPEQVRGKAELLDTRSDVYALGVVCYQLLTGRLPHDLKGKSITEAIRTISEITPRTLARSGASVPADVETIIAKALAGDPARRYDSASALGADIERYLQNRPILARPPHALYHLRKLVARNRLASTLAGILVVLLGVSAVLMASQTQRIRTERDRAAREARTAEEVSDFLQNLFAVTDPRVAQGYEPTARELLDEGAARIEKDLAQQPIVQIRLLVIMGDTYRNLGLHAEAQNVLERAVELSRTIVDQEPALAAHALQALAWLYNANARIPDGVTAAREAVAVTEAHLPPDHPERGRCLTSLGALLREDGQWDEARATLDRAVAFAAETYGEQAFEVAVALSHLAWLEHRLGRNPQSDVIYQRSCAMLEEVLEQYRPELASCYNDHSVVLAFLDRHAESSDLLANSIAIKEKILPPGHPDLAMAVNNLGSMYLRAGNHEQAMTQYLRALEMRREVLGAEHPDVGGALCNIGIAQRKMRRWADSEATFKECIEFLETAVGPDGREVTANLVNLIELYQDMGRFKESLAIEERLLSSRERTHGKDHAWYAGALRTRANTLIRLDRPLEAEADIRQAIGIIAETFPLERPGRANFDIELAEVLIRQERLSEARSILEAVRTAQQEVDPNSAKARCFFSLGRIALLEGDSTGGVELFQQALKIRQQHQSSNENNLLYTQAVVHALGGHREQALAALRGALELGYRFHDIDTRVEMASLKDDADLQALLTEFSP